MSSMGETEAEWEDEIVTRFESYRESQLEVIRFEEVKRELASHSEVIATSPMLG